MGRGAGLAHVEKTAPEEGKETSGMGQIEGEGWREGWKGGLGGREGGRLGMAPARNQCHATVPPRAFHLFGKGVELLGRHVRLAHLAAHGAGGARASRLELWVGISPWGGPPESGR